ncbi:MAG: HAMP domain-containing sensor histidine kinase, partial [Actinomycetota bacterium]|nr:HAMP domain-containing sensor histidine kinase [Actinomycetota bacterium]
LWLNATAAKVDRDTLNRGADAVTADIEEQIRILSLAGTGAKSLVGQSLDDIDLAQMADQLDISVLRSLIAIVTYPVTAEGAAVGEFITLDFQPEGFPAPEIDMSLAEVEELLETDEAFLSAPVTTLDPGRLDYVALMPVEGAGGIELVGVVFRIDRMLGDAVDAGGEGQYSAVVTDPDYGNQVVAAVGDPVGDIEAARSPQGLKGELGLVVRPGPDFPFSQSVWIPGLVIGVGFLVALLLVWMAKMVRTRSEDLAERLRLAEELNKSKDRFLAAVSHELRTPLTVVLGVADEVGPHWTRLSDGERQELLAMMSEQAHEAANIVEDLLVTARSDPTKLRLAMERTEIHPHVEYAMASLPLDARERISWSDVPQSVYADTTRLRQILRNLLENASKYGGANIELRSWQDQGRVHICVSDDGNGIDEWDVDRIFEPYERSDSASELPSGVGIGLFVSRLLARLMGGDLECVREGGWTRFQLWLPAPDRAPDWAVVGEPVATRRQH